MTAVWLVQAADELCLDAGRNGEQVVGFDDEAHDATEGSVTPIA